MIEPPANSPPAMTAETSFGRTRPRARPAAADDDSGKLPAVRQAEPEAKKAEQDIPAAAIKRKIPPSISPAGLSNLSKLALRLMKRKVETSYKGVADDLVAEVVQMYHRPHQKKRRRNETTAGDAAAGARADSHVHPPSAKNTKKQQKGGDCDDSRKSGSEKKKKKTEQDNPEKNIRRRVYDALNVMEAAGIVRKVDKSGIVFVGMPALRPPADRQQQRQRQMEDESPEYGRLRRERDACLRRIEEKRFELRESVLHSIGYRNLKRRNSSGASAVPAAAAAPMKDSNDENPNEAGGGGSGAAARRETSSVSSSSSAPSCQGVIPPRDAAAEKKQRAAAAAGGGGGERSLLKVPTDGRIPLPFMVANLPSTAQVSKSLLVTANGGTRMNFNFSEPFMIDDDHQILKYLGLCTTTPEEMKQWLDQDVMNYMHFHNLLGGIFPASDPTPNHHRPPSLCQGTMRTSSM